MENTENSKINWSLIATLFIAIVNGILVPVMFKVSDDLSKLQISQTKTESFVESFLIQGPRFTEKDYLDKERATLGQIQMQASRLSDHEMRIRALEKGKNN